MTVCRLYLFRLGTGYCAGYNKREPVFNYFSKMSQKEGSFELNRS